MPRSGRIRFLDQIPWLPFHNASGQPVPSFSCIQIDTWTLPDPSDPDAALSSSPVLEGYQPGTVVDPSWPPSSQINPWQLYLTGPVTVPADGFGECARPDHFPLLASIDGAGFDSLDQAGRFVGPSPGYWDLFRDLPGFVLQEGQLHDGLAFVRLSHGPYRGLFQSGSSNNQGEILINTIIEPYNDVGTPQLGANLQPINNPFINIDTTLTGAILRCTYDWVGSGNWELIAAAPVCN